MAKSKGRDMDEVPVKSGQNKVRASDLVDVYDIPEKWARLRFHGAVFTYGTHWVKTKTREGKPTKFPTPCLAYDSDSGTRDRTKHCPWCTFQASQGEDKESRQIDFSVEYWSNVLVRSLQKQKPSEMEEPTKAENKSGFKDKDSETWTPNRAVRLSASLMRKLKELKALNTHDTDDGTTAYSVSNTKYGCDVQLKLNKEGSAADKYGVQKGDPSPLKKEERAYLTYDLSNLQAEITDEEADAEFESWNERNNGGKKSKKKSKDEDDEDDDPKPKKKSKVVDDDDDEDEPKPKSKKKKTKDEDEDEDDDEDEDEKPKSKKKSKVVDDDDEDDDPPPKSKKKKSKGDEDDDEDDEPPKKSKKSKDEDEDDEDDEPPKKSKKKSKDVDEDEDEDEDDDPPPKKSKKKSKDEDDDEDDDPPPKKSKGKAKPKDEDDDFDDDDEDEKPKKGKKSKKSKDEDEDDDD